MDEADDLNGIALYPVQDEISCHRQRPHTLPDLGTQWSALREIAQRQRCFHQPANMSFCGIRIIFRDPIEYIVKVMIGRRPDRNADHADLRCLPNRARPRATT